MSKFFFFLVYYISKYFKNVKKKFEKTQNNDLFIAPTAAADYNERFRDMYTFSELVLNIRKVGKIVSRKMQGQSALSTKFLYNVLMMEV